MSIDRQIVSPVLVGREADLVSLDRLLARAAQGSGQTLLLSGEAGIGKSRLVAELELRARHLDFAIAKGSCFEPDRSLPFAPLVDLLRDASSLYRAGDRARPGVAGDVLGRLLPELTVETTEPVPPPLRPELEKRRLFDALVEFLRGPAEARPLLLVIEDLHWSDDTSLEFFHYFARRLGASPILLLLTYRSDDVRRPLSHFLAELDRERLGVELRLPPLAVEEVRVMLAAIFGEQHRIRPGFVETIFDLTEGNPFFIEEVLQALIASGQVYHADGEWHTRPTRDLHVPRSVHDAVQQRLGGVSAAARNVLALAAVVGRRFDFGLLQALTGHDEPRLLRLIKELIAAQLVVEAGPDAFAFRHALTRQAIYGDLLARERKLLHRSIGKTLDRLYEAALEPHVEALSYHYYEAGAWAKALEYAERSGSRAQSLYAHRVAYEQFTRAIEATRQAAAPCPPRLLRARGLASEMLGETERARVDYEAALAASIDRDRVAEWQALVDLGLLWAGRDYARTGEYYRRAFELARSLADPAILAHSLNRMGNWYLNVDQPGEAYRHHEQAFEIFRGLADRPGMAETLDLLGVALYMNGDLIRGTDCYERAVALFRELDNRQGLVSSLATMTMRGATYQSDSMVPAASLAECAREGELALQVARETGQWAAEAYVQVMLAFCRGAAGDYRAALAAGNAAREVAETIGHRQWTAAALCALGALGLDLLATGDARRHLEPALAISGEVGSLCWFRRTSGLLASSLTLEREFDRAESVLAAATPADPSYQTCGQRMVWCARAELALARGQPEETLQIVGKVTSSNPVTQSPNRLDQAPDRRSLRLERLRGEALAALARPAEAEAALETARVIAAAQGARAAWWRIDLALGKLFASQRRAAEAARAFAEARSIVEDLAANILAPELQAEFRRKALAMLPEPKEPSTREATRRTFGGLTAREHDVAVLVASGKSNRVIAEALVVSERTVETHVARIMAKLGFDSRVQIATWLAGTRGGPR